MPSSTSDLPSMDHESSPDRAVRRRAAFKATLVPHASMLPLGEQFLLWTLRQWQCEVASWDAQQKLPPGGSALRRGFELASLAAGLPHFAMVMDAFLCGAGRPLEIHPLATPIISPDEGTLLALFGLAQHGFDGPLEACFSAMLPTKNCAPATIQLRLLADLMKEAGLGSPSSDGDSWIQ